MGCEHIRDNGAWDRHMDEHIKAPYGIFNADGLPGKEQWFGYDDTESIRIKAALVNQYGLKGGMTWSIETDDFRGVCGLGYSPLIKTMRDEMNKDVTTTTRSTTTTRRTTTTTTTKPTTT